jgi:nifR3 family TIM-barrel protein
MIFYPDNTLIMAPLSGFTDLPYRRSLRRHGCYYAFTEMIDAGSLAYSNPNVPRMLSRGEEEPWLGVQLVGADEAMLLKSVEVLNTYHFDLLDFNLGCPVPKVAKKGAGAVLGRKTDEAARLLELLVKHSRIPVTAKTRIVSEDDPEQTVRLARKLEDAGAQTLTIHGRIKERVYSGPVFHDIIAEVRKAVKIPVVANGGIVNRASWEDALCRSGCTVAMAARGAMGNPWLFDEVRDPDHRPPTLDELADEIALHIGEMTIFYGDEAGFRIARKVVLDYLRGRRFPGALRNRVSFLKSHTDLNEILDEVRQPAAAGRQTGFSPDGIGV